MVNPKDTLYIERAHRVGYGRRCKTRPIVAKFNTDSKNAVKVALRNVNLKGTDYNVLDQFPPEVKDRRKQLIPVMLDARRQGKRATLVRDKLYINNVLYNPDSGSAES